jgi:hypothetical protein
MRSISFSLLTAMVAVCLTASSPAYAQGDKITAARLKGLEFLRGQQTRDGSWEYENHNVGITALVTVALLANGASLDEPEIDRAYRYVRKNVAEQKHTYDIALAIILLSRIDEYHNRSLIRDLAGRLFAGQLTSGGWSYTCSTGGASSLTDRRLRSKLKSGPGDNSCTQFAVLGLWTASRIGIDIDGPLELVAERFLKSQNTDGGWPYRGSVEEGKVEPTKNSMTFAGLFCLTVARATKLRKMLQAREEGTTTREETPETGSQGEALMKDPVFKKGFDRAVAFASGSGSRYFLWSMERVGVMLNLEKLGAKDWFKLGADALVRTQQPDGAWPDAQGGLADTSFAVLFLRKANLGSDISRLLEGEPDKPFLIAGRPDKPRFDDLAKAVAAAKPGETIRIDGEGPYKLPHVILNQDVTIQAGPGYLPKLVYDVGINRIGVRARPSRDDICYMLQVAKGTTTLEGLKIEMTPTDVSPKIDWAAIRVAGGNLRVLNCTISDADKKVTALIQIQQPGQVTVNNSMLIGGRAGVEVSVNGVQTAELNNALIYSENAVSLVSPKKTSTTAKTNINLNRVTIQADEVVAVDKTIKTPIAVDSQKGMYKTIWISSSLSGSTTAPGNRTWTGSANIYDPKRWVGRAGIPVASITDEKSWTKFWGGKEEDAKQRSIVFTRTHSARGFSHRARALEWRIGETTKLAFENIRAGIQYGTVGSGRAYGRYRESILYNEWQAGKSN